ncbi:MAG: tetratricopeptide repeat protein [Alphaproteobacteria bacterium]|nr:tetratricopeptide repeat protein [Alphaproteobacteria bacterium]MBF0129208.1 tetratricopeptide repeat protein [Alphaproteobacteria bacterium]
MGQKMDFVETVALYAQFSGMVAKRIANNMVQGFQSVFSLDEETRRDFFRERGIEQAKRGRYAAAVAVLKPIHEAVPDDAEVMLYLGLSSLRVGRQEEGLLLLEGAYAALQDIKSATVLGIAYSQAGLNDKAIPFLQMAADANHNNFNVRYRLGLAYDNNGEHDKAIECLLEALELRPEDPKVYRSIAFSYEQKGEHETAVGYFKRASDLEEAHAQE